MILKTSFLLLLAIFVNVHAFAETCAEADAVVTPKSLKAPQSTKTATGVGRGAKSEGERRVHETYTSEPREDATTANSSGSLSKPCSVTVALDWTPNTNHLGLYIAAQNRLMHHGGRPVEFRFIQPKQTNATQLVATGQADFGISFVQDVVRARAVSLPVLSVAAIMAENTSCFAWRKSSFSKLNSAKDFENKRYGGWGSADEETTLRYLMEKAGGDFKKLKIVVTGVVDFLQATPRLADFMWIYLGWDGVRARLAGVDFETLCPGELDPIFNTPSPLVITSDSWVSRHGVLVKDFLRAASVGYAFATQNPREASRILSRAAPELDEKLVAASTDYLVPYFKKRIPLAVGKGQHSWGWQSPQMWKQNVEWMSKQKLLENASVDDKKLFSNEFLPADFAW